MSAAWKNDESSGAYNNHRPPPAQRGDRNGRMYDDQYTRPRSRDQHRRSSSSPGRYASPHDRTRTSRGGHTAGVERPSDSREWNNRARDDKARSNDDHRKGQSPVSRGDTRRGYQDRDREDYRSPGYDSRSRSRSPRRDRSPFFGGPPSREVILEGIPLDMVEDDISKELKQYHDVGKLDDIRVIRDRQTKVSRGFGFLRFSDLEKSRAFIERNYPMIYLYGNGSTDSDDQAAKVRIAYSRERDDRSRTEKAEGEWTCKICTFVNFPGRTKCFRCQTPQIDMNAFGVAAPAKPTNYMNSGDSDASPNGTPSQFLLLRGLEPAVTEDLLAKGVAKLYKPGRRSPPPATTASKKGNAKVASTTGDANLGAKEGSLRRILLVRDRRSNESWRYGFAEFGTVDDAQAALTRFNSFEKFTISSKPVTADYIHAGVFVPVFNAIEKTNKFTFSPLGNTATKLAYWDEEAWVSELIVSSTTSKKSTNTSESQIRSATDRAAAAAENEGLLTPGKEADAKAKKRKAEATAAAKQKKTAPAHLQFWSNRHAELHGVKSDASLEEDQDPNGNLDTLQKPGTQDEESTPTQTFVDPEKNCCYLCSRQFKTLPELHKHERLSQLHRDNLKNPDLLSKGHAKMEKAGLPSTISQDTAEEYRDRAKERRAAFGASKKTLLPLKKPNPSSTNSTTKSPSPEPPKPSKGASLLGKMGWSAGEGLGAQGTGMTAPIATDMYVQGVGLGAAGGKIGDAGVEAGRNTKGGYGAFAERTREVAKERFEKMG